MNAYLPAAGALAQAQPAQKSALVRVLSAIGGAEALKAVRGAVDEPLPVHTIVKDGTPRTAPDHQMVHCTGGIDAGMSRHEEIVSAGESDVNRI